MLHWDADAIVLSGADSRDDKIVRLVVESDEVIPAVVRFARKAGRSSKGSRVQPLTGVHVALRAKPADELALLETVRVEAPHAVLKGDLARFALGTAMAEVVLHLVPDWGQEAGLYALVLRALEHLDDPKAKVGEELLALFELRMLDLAGVLPPLEELAELPAGAREALAAWRQGQFRPLPEGALRPTARFLEQALMAASGRPFVSRAFLDQVLGL